MTAHASILAITDRIVVERSKPTREAYLDQVNRAAENGPHRGVLSCGNLAHGFAACSVHDKEALAGDRVPNLGIITAYNDMLSAHQPFERYPDLIRTAAKEAGRRRAGCRRCSGHVRWRYPGGSRAWTCPCSRAM